MVRLPISGEGVINLVGFFQALRKTGYGVGVSPEVPCAKAGISSRLSLGDGMIDGFLPGSGRQMSHFKCSLCTRGWSEFHLTPTQAQCLAVAKRRSSVLELLVLVKTVSTYGRREWVRKKHIPA
jgi:hypothetical protein